jgi:hypothetical protein
MNGPAIRERASPNHDSRGEVIAGHARASTRWCCIIPACRARGGARPAVRSRGARQFALRHRGGRHDLAAGARRAPRLARRGVVLDGGDHAQHRFDRHRDRQSGPRMGLPPVPRSADAGGGGAVPAISSRGGASPLIASSAIPTSPQPAKAIPASCSIGRASRAPGSGCGRRPSPKRDRDAAGEPASSSGLAPSPTSHASATRSCPALRTTSIAAFQRRYRPERWDGKLDGETSNRLAEVRQAVEAALAVGEQAKRERFRNYRRLN